MRCARRDGGGIATPSIPSRPRTSLTYRSGGLPPVPSLRTDRLAWASACRPSPPSRSAAYTPCRACSAVLPAEEPRCSPARTALGFRTPSHLRVPPAHGLRSHGALCGCAKSFCRKCKWSRLRSFKRRGSPASFCDGRAGVLATRTTRSVVSPAGMASNTGPSGPSDIARPSVFGPTFIRRSKLPTPLSVSGNSGCLSMTLPGPRPPPGILALWWRRRVLFFDRQRARLMGWLRAMRDA